MSSAEMARHLGSVPQWRPNKGALERSYQFDNFYRTMAFVNVVAWVAHEQDHHPELQVSYGQCTVRWNTHSVDGVSINDFICAAKLDALLQAGTG